MKTLPKLIFDSKADTVTELKSDAEGALELGMGAIRFMNQPTLAEAAYLAISKQYGERLTILADTALLNRLPNEKWGVYYKLPEWDEADTNNMTVLTCGQAFTNTDCMNWELKGVDLIDYNSSQHITANPTILGSEGLQQLSPKNETYGWMLMSVNTPIFVSGLNTLRELQQLAEKTNFQGAFIRKNFNKETLTPSIIDKIQDLLA